MKYAMNLDKFEPIQMNPTSVIEAIRTHGSIFDEAQTEFKFNEFDMLIFRTVDAEGFNLSNLKYNDLGTRRFYYPKPFDVRQAMFDRPNEWVGAYQDEEGRRWKFGFETESFQTVAIPFNINTKLPLYETYRKNGNWTIASRKAIENCIPIEDAPEEATR